MVFGKLPKDSMGKSYKLQNNKKKLLHCPVCGRHLTYLRAGKCPDCYTIVDLATTTAQHKSEH
jgi:hypothetical protein